MKKYTLSMGASIGYNHPHPERTAVKSGIGMFADDIYQVWPNRESMARSIRMQQKRAPQQSDWRPLVALHPHEGR